MTKIAKRPVRSKKAAKPAAKKAYRKAAVPQRESVVGSKDVDRTQQAAPPTPRKR